MKLKFAAAITGALCLLGTTHAASIELVVDYPYPEMFNDTHQAIARKFAEKFPGYSVKFRAPTPDYEVAAQQALRHAVTKQLADVSFQGLNRQRIFVDRGIAVDLTPFIRQEKNWEHRGYSASLMTLGQIQGKQVGVGFALSTPIVYYNMDLLGKTGMTASQLPRTWDDILRVSNASRKASANTNGLYFDWRISGNWLWQSLVFSMGGKILDEAEKKVVFNDAIGQRAMEQMGRMVQNGTMDNISYKEASQMFVSGRLAVLVSSTSRLGVLEKQIGNRFKLVTGMFPVPAQNGRVPAGGNVAMMFTKNPERQKAAWEFIKFATGPEGATIMTKNTGYFPANTLPIDDPERLKGYYDQNPNQYTAVKQITLLTSWYAFPGENGLKITDVIDDHTQTVFDRSAKPADALKAMAADVQKLLD
ncbi:ABC transporter substrate-binding protein [Cupriavidus necator]